MGQHDEHMTQFVGAADFPERTFPVMSAHTRLPVVAAASLGILVSLLLLQSAARAEQRILSFHSDITVQTDGSAKVAETIRVRLDGTVPGIKRALLLRYTGSRGEQHSVDIRDLSAKRAGKKEDENDMNMHSSSPFSIKFSTGYGSSGPLPAGEYTYTIQYAVHRPVGFPAGRNEIYWDVTGNDWPCPIDAASAKVRLSKSVDAPDLLLSAYVGEKNTPTDYVAEVEEPSVVSFATTRPLAAREGLAVAVSFPRSVLSGISPGEQMLSALRERLAPHVIWAGLALVFLYYLAVWRRVGRDPAKGVITMKSEPPADASPAVLRATWRMGFDAKAFAVAILTMAAKGLLRIEDSGGVFRLVREHRDRALSREEREAANAIFTNGDTLTLDETLDAMLKARESCKTAVLHDTEKTYFLSNMQWFIPGIVLSILVVLATVLSLSSGNFPVIFLAVWLTGWTAGVSMMFRMFVGEWKFFRAGKWKALAGLAAGVGCFSPWWLAEIFVAGMLMMMLGAAAVAEIVAVGVMGLVFYRLLKAPTRLGRRRMDEIEGFRLFLAEDHPVDADADPKAAAKTFHEYLPYAIALEKETEWTQRFANAIAASGIAPNDDRYAPPWYKGDCWKSEGAAGFVNRMADIFVDVVWACAVTPMKSGR